MFLRVFYFGVWMCLLPLVLPAQKAIEPSKMKQFNITVNFEDYTVKTQMLSHAKQIRADNDKTYMWYHAQRLMETRGGYDGKLIHGAYSSFYLNNQLREKGRLRYGLKQGEWKYWYADGKLKEVIHWKGGRKQGRYLLYNDHGQLMAKSKFKRDRLHGRFYTYGGSGIVIENKRYKHGEECKPRKRFLRSALFRSKQKQSAPAAEEMPRVKKNKTERGAGLKFWKRKKTDAKKTEPRKQEPPKTVNS